MSVWDHYLDADDAALLLDAAAVVEHHHAVREPLPLHDAHRLLDRLHTIATLSAEDAVHWQREAEDRREEATADGGRWGRADVAARMATLATATADALADIARVTGAAAADLVARLGPTSAPDPVGDLLDELGLGPDGPADGDLPPDGRS